ncbi:MATE family efflux transporter [Streptomyces sp. NPDC004031]
MRPRRRGRARTAGREQVGALGTEPVGRLLLRTCAQTTMSVGVFGIYALTNAWFVARGVGPDALAAVNLLAPVLLAVGAVSTAVGVGGASLVSRSLGAADPAGAARAAGNAFVFFWACAAAVGATGLLALDPLLTVLGATAGTRGYAHDYGQILFAGTVMSTGFSSLMRAEGRMRFSTLQWVLPVVTQMCLDPLLIYGCGLGVRGAALGTVGGQTVSAATSVWFFFLQRPRPYRVTLADLRPHGPTLRRLLAVGAPSFLVGFGATVVAALANTRLVALGGPLAVAAFALCGRVGTFAAMPQTGIAQGLQPLVGYNAGRGLAARAERATGLALRATVGYGCAVCVVLLCAADPVVSLFTGDPALHAQAVAALRLFALVPPCAGLAPLVCARFQALGQPRPAYLISVVAVVAVRVPLLFALGRFGTRGVLASFPLAELVTAVLALLVLHRSRAPAAAGTEPRGGQQGAQAPG